MGAHGDWLLRARTRAKCMLAERLGERADSPRERAGMRAAALLLLLTGLTIASANLDRGMWLDELFTLARTAPDLTLAAFADAMIDDGHPLGHYGLVLLARRIGIEAPSALRALSALGVAVVALAIRHACARGALSRAQALTLCALYASSPLFFLYLCELRGYFLAFSGSVAVSCVWLTVCNGPASRGDLARWGGVLAFHVNAHYFALPLDGLLTVGALCAQRRHAGRPLGLALVSLAASAPALLMLSLQVAHGALRPGAAAHLVAGPIDVLGLALRAALAAAGRNGIAAILALLALITLLRDRSARPDARRWLVLACTVGALTLLYAAISAQRPIINDRYLVVGAGVVTVLVAGLAASPGAPRVGPWLVCLVALALQLRMGLRAQYAFAHWRASAQAVAALTRACPETRVHAALLVHHTNDALRAPPIWRTGYRYYAHEQGFSFSALRRGDVVTPGTRCPSVIWLENAYKVAGSPVAHVLDELQVATRGSASVRYVGSGALVLVR